jgi:hypothetical protein
MSCEAQAVISTESLAEAIRYETRLLRDLVTILRLQRDAVAQDDVDELDDGVQSIHRLVLTLTEVRRRRHLIVEGLTGAREVAISRLESVIDPTLAVSVFVAREALFTAARELSRAISLNNRILQAAIRAGDNHIRALTGQPAGALTYEAGPQPERRGPSAVSLLDRQV